MAGATPGGAATVVAIMAAVGLLGAAAVHDLRTHRIPNRLLAWSAGGTVAAAALGGVPTLGVVALGGLLAGGPMLLVLLARGIGMGDVKMAGVIGGTGGLVHPLVGPASVMVMAFAVAVTGAVTGRRRWALGPWLWSAFVCTSAAVALWSPGAAR